MSAGWDRKGNNKGMEEILYRYRGKRKKKTGGGGEGGRKEVLDDAKITTSGRGPFFGDRPAARRQCTQ